MRTALDRPEPSPRELAVRYLVSEAPVYRLLKAHDLVTSVTFIVMKGANKSAAKPWAQN